jgi:fatty-acyl-CoA synthase
VAFHGSFTEIIERIRDRVPRVATWLWVDDGSGPCPSWAVAYETAATSYPDRVVAPWGRDGDHLYMFYTGGTTGMPKGVMWRQDDHIRNVVAMGSNPRYREDPVDYDVTRELVQGPGAVSLPACPLMHGTGCMTQLINLSGGGCVVTLESRNLDIEELFDTIEREKVNSIAIVGDAFAKPMLRALDAEPDRWDLTSLFLFASSGVMFSEASKQALIGHLPHAMIVDAFSSSEASAWASRCRPRGRTPPPPRSARASTPRSSLRTCERSSRALATSVGWPSVASSPSGTTRTRPRPTPPS